MPTTTTSATTGESLVERFADAERGPRGVPRGPRHVQGHDHRDRPHGELLRQHLRCGAAPRAARCDRRADLRRGVRGRRLSSASYTRDSACRGTRATGRARPPRHCSRRSPGTRKETHVHEHPLRVERARSRAPQPRQGARHLRAQRRDDADRRHRPPVRVRRDPADADPRQGRGAHPGLQLLVRHGRGTSSPTTSSTRSRSSTGPTRSTCRGAPSQCDAASRSRSRRSCAAI